MFVYSIFLDLVVSHCSQEHVTIGDPVVWCGGMQAVI